jgi:hypothetical protein
VTKKHPARREPVPALTVLRWPDHPPAIGAADQFADCGHDTKRSLNGQVMGNHQRDDGG